MEMNMENKYTKIKAFGDPNNGDITDGEMEITEKLDGANGSVILVDDKFVMRSRNRELLAGIETQKNWNRAHEYLSQIHEATPFVDGLIYYGEVMVHHTINYGVGPAFIGFAVYDIENDIYLNDWHTHFESRGIPTPTRTYVTDISVDTLIEEYGEKKSEFGTEGAIAEGFVVKNYQNQNFAKFVREEFKEDNRKAFGGGLQLPKQKTSYKITERFCTSQRINKGIFSLNEDGMQIEMQMMATLPQAVFDDIIAEEFFKISREYRSVDFGEMRKFIARKCVKRLKEFMLERA